jgi:hypothetical protein
MSIIISQNLVLSADDGLTLDHPIVGWQNIATPANLVATSEEVNYPASNLANPATHVRWRASSTDAQYITVTTGSADAIDYVAIVRHNLATAGVETSIEANYGVGYNVLLAPVFLANNGPTLFRFISGPCVSIRLKLSDGDIPAEIAAIYVGKLLVLPRKLYQGLTPPPHARVSKVTNGVSEAGDFLGRIETQRRIETKIPLSLIDPTYYRDHIDEFLAVSKTTPFFFGWRPQTYPDEIGYCSMTNDPQPINQSPHGLIAMDFEMTGVV